MNPARPPGHRHGRIAYRVGYLLGVAVAAAQDDGDVLAAETGFRIGRDPDTVRAPDVAYVAAGRLSADGELDGYLDLVPDLVVEVLSPSDRAGEVRSKARAWISAGATLVWVVYPDEQSMVVHGRDGSVTLVGGDGELAADEVVPEVRIALADVFGPRRPG